MDVDVNGYFGYSTADEKLRPLIETIAGQLQQISLRQGFHVLKDYGRKISFQQRLLMMRL